MANPLSWLPFHGDKKSARAAMLGGALTLSLFIHVGLPFMNWHRGEAVSESPVTVTFMPPPPIPLPEADEPVMATDEDDSPDPKIDAPVQKTIKPATKEAQKEPEHEEKPPPPDSAPPEVVVKTDDDRAARLAALEKLRADRIAERARKRAEREAAAAARRAQLGSGGVKGGAPDSGEWKTGKPDAVYMCGADDKGDELHITKARPLSEWIPIVPTVLAGFDTRPGLGGYLDHIQQVVSRDRTQLPRRIGFVEMSLPNDVLQFPLEEPRGVRVAVGRLDARCLIGFKYASNLFPFSILRAPARIIDAQNNTVSALVDVTFYKDASLEITTADGTPLPFKRGRLKNAKGIQHNIEDHYEAARLAKGIAELFGIDLRPKVQAQKPPPKKTIAEAKTKRAQD